MDGVSALEKRAREVLKTEGGTNAVQRMLTVRFISRVHTAADRKWPEKGHAIALNLVSQGLHCALARDLARVFAVLCEGLSSGEECAAAIKEFSFSWNEARVARIAESKKARLERRAAARAEAAMKK